MLLDARDAGTGEAMSDAEVVDEVMTLVIAGHETTSSTLNWTWWLLATVASSCASPQSSLLQTTWVKRATPT